jgi:UrcA family protein
MISKLNSLTGIAGAALVAIVLGAHPCTAQTIGKTVKVAFAYHPADPAGKIYSHLQSVARDACVVHGSRSLRIDAQERACMRELLDKAVASIGRADLARLHGDSLAAYAYAGADAAKAPAPLAIPAR